MKNYVASVQGHLRQLKNWLNPIQLPQSDDFIRRLPSLVIGEGMLHRGNITLLEYAIQHLPAEGSVVEIGSYGGLSTNLITHLLQKYHKNNPLFNCDAWIYEGYHDHLGESGPGIDGRADVSRTDYAQYLKNAFVQATQLLHPQRLPHSFHLRSEVFFQKWQQNATETDLFGRTATLGGPIALAYIDGDHSYEGAMLDVEHTARFLVKNGFMLLDDSADHLSFGSAAMMREIKQDRRFRVINKNPNYLIQRVG